MTKIKKFIAGLILLPCLLLASLPAAAQNNLDPACLNDSTSPECLASTCSKKPASDSPVCKDANNPSTNNPIAGDDGIIRKATDIIALVTGVAAVIMVIIGAGFYVTAGGNAENAAKARSRIVAALVGLVIISLAWLVVRFVIDNIIK